MTKDDLRLLYEYDMWANNRILRATSALTPEQFTRNLGGGFRSVRDTLVHIVASEWGWVRYWKESSPGPEVLPDLWTKCDVLFNSGAFPDVAAVQLKWKEVQQERAEFTNCLTVEILARVFPVDSTQISLARLMYHLLNHSSYHRGQIALMLGQLRIKPPVTDFHEFLADVPGSDGGLRTRI